MLYIDSLLVPSPHSKDHMSEERLDLVAEDVAELLRLTFLSRQDRGGTTHDAFAATVTVCRSIHPDLTESEATEAVASVLHR